MIAYGKVMDDEAKTVADYKIVENGFIVMMTLKVSSPLVHKTQEETTRLREGAAFLRG